MKIGENGISSNGFERKFRCDLASSSVKILVASTKSSNIAGIPSFGGLLGLIRKRLVEFRLDFLAFIRIDQILPSPSLVDIPPVFVFVQSSRQALLILVLWLQKMATKCSFGFWFGFDRFFMPAAPCSV